MLSKFRPSPAMAIAFIALFVAMAGSAVAAGVPALAKRALVADNAKKLEGKTAAQVAALVKIPPPVPVTSVATLISIKSGAMSLAAGAESTFSVACDVGAKAIGGGFDNPTTALVIDAGDKPSPDGGSWSFDMINLSQTTPASGTVFASCIK